MLPARPDLIIVSPMARTIQTAQIFLRSIKDNSLPDIPIIAWPDLREAYDADCNKGRGRADLEDRYPQLDFSLCAEEWNYEAHSIEAATERAERVRQKLKGLMETHRDIAIFSHIGFINYLVQGAGFKLSGRC
jgi:broad specificity phosphatase PhoE